MSSSDSARDELAADVFRRLSGPGEAPPWAPLEEDAPGLGALIREGLGGILAGPRLDLRTRELATVCMLAALGGCEPQLAFHARGALRAGATPEEVVEAVAQVAVYAGVPRTLNALAVVRPALSLSAASPAPATR
ncbi:carboxymuconolactone decarboxylase family protein [Streptacidiphilus monticola]|uniref:Carboxymuconolactone decarboxylase family protein n=1 Tax=Streptacidiphilus monticola TaxID=2161674 RepID=A0ABW1GB20_9ACTN